MDNILFEFYRGDTYTRDFTVTGWSLSISQIYFTVKEAVGDKKFVLQKTLGNGITLVDKEDGIETYNLKICCTDTDNMKTDKDYVFDIEIHSQGVEETIKKTIVTGTLRLKASATRTCNEC
jgi:hypothetical protein